MDNNSGYIKLHRKMADWEWFTDVNTAHLFTYILIRANWQDTSWRGEKLDAGEFITSYSNLAEATGLTVQEVRTSLKKLEKTGEITRLSTQHKFSKIKVLHYVDYQDSNNIATIKQQYNNNIVTIDKNNKNINNYKNTLSGESREQSFVVPSREDVQQYFLDHNFRRSSDEFFDYNEARGWKGIENWQAMANLFENKKKGEYDNEDLLQIQREGYGKFRV